MEIRKNGDYLISDGETEKYENLYIEVRKFDEDYYDICLKTKHDNKQFGKTTDTGIKNVREATLIVYRLKKLTGVTDIREIDEMGAGNIV